MKRFLLKPMALGIFSLFLFHSKSIGQVLVKGTLTGSNFDVKIGGNYNGVNYPGHHFIFIALSSNSGANTLSINSGTPAPILKNINQALTAGDIKTNQAVPVIFDGTNFQILSLNSTSSLQWLNSTVPSAIYYALGRVGIGTSTPSSRLDVTTTNIEPGIN
ncbi:MAG: hypothetical protein K2Q22_04825, partial [Cytophagales bacterium]|nr:hypothetical protein [Cytophagales bacterium]